MAGRADGPPRRTRRPPRRLRPRAEPAVLAAQDRRRPPGAHLRPGQRRGGHRRPRPRDTGRGVQTGLRPPGGGRPQPRRRPVRPVLVLALARPGGAPGASGTRPPLRRRGPHHTADPRRTVPRRVDRTGRPLHPARPGRTRTRHPPGAVAGPDDAGVGRGVLRGRLPRPLPARGPRPDHRQRRGRGRRVEVHPAAAPGPPRPAHRPPSGTARPRPAAGAVARTAHRTGAGVLPPGHLLQHGRRADVRGHGPPAARPRPPTRRCSGA